SPVGGVYVVIHNHGLIGIGPPATGAMPVNAGAQEACPHLAPRHSRRRKGRFPSSPVLAGAASSRLRRRFDLLIKRFLQERVRSNTRDRLAEGPCANPIAWLDVSVAHKGIAFTNNGRNRAAVMIGCSPWRIIGHSQQKHSVLGGVILGRLPLQ